MRCSLRQTPRHRRGAILVLVAVILPVFLIMAAFAVDVAWMQLVRTELRTATDAAARAGAKVLSIDQSTASARSAAIDAASRNSVAGRNMRIVGADVEFGLSSQSSPTSRFSFASGGSPITGVRVQGKCTSGSAAGPVALFFGGVLGVRQFQPQLVATSTLLDRDICLVVDRSGSMQGQKIADLKNGVLAFLEELTLTTSDEQVGFVSYSTSSTIQQRLTLDYNAIRTSSNSMRANGFTAIGLGLQDGLTVVLGAQRRPFAVPIVVLMTDGIHNTGVVPSVPARTAAAQGVLVHTVTFGADADQRQMQQVASITGGRHLHADTGADLAAAFREIARTLPVMLTD